MFINYGKKYVNKDKNKILFQVQLNYNLENILLTKLSQERKKQS